MFTGKVKVWKPDSITGETVMSVRGKIGGVVNRIILRAKKGENLSKIVEQGLRPEKQATAGKGKS